MTSDFIASDFTFNNGLSVTDAVKGISGETYTLTTSPQVAGTTYDLTLQGTDTTKTFVGVAAAQTNQFSITSAEARSNTQVTVVLSDAPLKNLTASDFYINGLSITGVTTNNNVVTLQTSSQVTGGSYTVTAVTGVGSATFTGVAAVNTSGVIQGITVPDLRQIKVTFNRPMTWTGFADTKSNYYLQMTDETSGNVQTNSLATIDATDEWSITPGDQDVTANDATVNYVIIESKDGSLLTDSLVSGGLGLAYNKTINLEVRNLDQKLALNYINTSDCPFTVSDTVAPQVLSVENASVNGLQKTVVNNNFLGNGTTTGYKLVDGRAYAVVNFSEPVTDTTDANASLATINTSTTNPDFKLYIDGIAVPQTTASADMKAFIVDTLSVGKGKAVEFNASVVNQKTMLLDVTDLSRGQHTIKIVGAEDLKGNVMSPNPYQGTFTVSDEVKTPPNDNSVKAAVKNIKQISDNAFSIFFDQNNVGIADTSGTAPVTIEKAEWDQTSGKWVDITVDPNHSAITHLSDLTTHAGIVTGTYVDTDGKTKTVWTVLMNANNGKPASSATGTTLDYDSQKIVARDVVVQNYVDTANASNDPYYVGDAYRTNVSFTKDTVAPVADTKVGYDVNAGTLTINFTDAPFSGDIAKTTDATKKIKVSMTDKNAQTYDEYLTVTGTGATVTNDPITGHTLTLNVTSTGVDDGASSLVDSNGHLFNEGVYTISMPQGSITDTDEDVSGTVGNDLVAIDPAAPNGIVATNLSVVIPPAGSVVTPEGPVPQTTKGLIASGVDIQQGATAVDQGTTPADAGTPGTVAYMKDAHNQDQIIVVFDGQVLESSALNKANYTFNNAPLPQNSDVAFYSGDVNSHVSIDATTTKDDFVLIKLPSGSVQKDGEYTIGVSGITNNAGKMMLPVTDSVALTDNTQPTAISVAAIGSKQIELTFDEKVVLAGSVPQETHNFIVTVNGTQLAVTDVALKDGEPNKVILTLSQDFDKNGSLNVPISVKVTNDSDGNMFITDFATPANNANQVTVHN